MDLTDVQWAVLEPTFRPRRRLLTGPTAAADTVVIGGTDLNNCAPFGACGYAGVYQQVYAARAFPGPVTITQIAFASFPQVNPTTIISDLSLGLSTTARPVNGLSTDYAANRARTSRLSSRASTRHSYLQPPPDSPSSSTPLP
jgi:hypothetical protein